MSEKVLHVPYLCASKEYTYQSELLLIKKNNK